MPLFSPQELKSLLPILDTQAAFIEQSRETIQNLLTGKDRRLGVVIGPCSIHNLEEALEYARLLKKTAQNIQSSCFVVMRVYIEKPRTSTGWKGLLYDPHLNDSCDLKTGLVWTRRLLLDIASLGVPAAVEFLDPLASAYFDDLVSWGFIGARTASSQIHRQLASLLPMPIGFKNSLDGDVTPAINGMVSARSSHTFLHPNHKGKVDIIKSEGNIHTHLVLRGSLDKTNYDAESIKESRDKIQKTHPLLCPKILIDCSHGNSQKDPLKQRQVFRSVLEQKRSGSTSILGVMIESNLLPGDQSSSPALRRGVSLTDSCLGWEESEELLSSLETSNSSGVMRFTQS